jgi:hypothetical protein
MGPAELPAMTEHEFIWEAPPRKPDPARENMIRGLTELAKSLDPSDTPFTELLPMGKGPPPTPDFCFKEKKESIEPYMTLYEMTLDIISHVEPESSDYDDEWYETVESPGLTKLRKLAYTLGLNAYKEVENPAYDEDQCRAWKEENLKSWTKVEWGQGTVVPVDESVIITPDGPRVIDEGVEV